MNILKEVFSNLLLVLVLVMGAALFLSSRILDGRDKALATANETIATQREANDQMATEFYSLQLQEKGLRQLLDRQATLLGDLDNQNRRTADELQQALATPTAGRPDCAREPLPGAALRLLQPTHHRGANQGGQAATAGGAGAPLPGTDV